MFLGVYLLCVSVCERRYIDVGQQREKQRERNRKRKREQEKELTTDVETETYKGLFVLSKNHN